MKIALTLQCFAPHRGETEAACFELARQLLRLDNEVHVVAQEFSEGALEIPIVPHRIRPARTPLRRAAIAQAKLRSLDTDVIHDMGLISHADVYSSPVGSPLGMWQRQLEGAAWWARPFKRIVHRTLAGYRRRDELARRHLEDSDSIVLAPSGMVAEDYRSIHGIPPDRIRVVYPGVDIKKFTPHIRKLRRHTTRRKLGIDGKGLLLLSVADPFQQASWKIVFHALRRLIRRRVPVGLIVTASQKAVSVKKLADRLGVVDHVRFVGPNDRQAYYAAADVLVLPTFYTPFSLAILEAAACGLPSITTCRNGAAELLNDGTDGYLLKRPKAADLAERIELFRDPARCERMGRAARRTAMKFTLERSAGAIVQIYEEIAEAHDRVDLADGEILKLPDEKGCRSHAAPRRAA